MDVKKININQSEQIYNIASDIYDVTANNNDAKFSSLSALLSDENLSTFIPTAVRCGGMSIRFVQSSDNKYVQYRLMTNVFSTTVSDWQGVDNEPTVGSDNLVKSGGVADVIKINATNIENLLNDSNIHIKEVSKTITKSQTTINIPFLTKRGLTYKVAINNSNSEMRADIYTKALKNGGVCYGNITGTGTLILKANYDEDHFGIYFPNPNNETFDIKIAISTANGERLETIDTLISYFKSDRPIEIEIVWKNANGYWNNYGNIKENTDYDISEPIDVTSFKYLGFYGILNKGNLCIVSVDASGNFTGQIIQYGLLEWQNSGLSLYTFKVPDDVDYISLSVLNGFKPRTKLFQLKSPYLIDILDTKENLNNTIGKNIKSSTTSKAFNFFTNVKQGDTISVTINKQQYTKGISVFGMISENEYDQLFSFAENGTKYTTAKNTYNAIRLYDNDSNTEGFDFEININNLIKKYDSVAATATNTNVSELLSYFKSDKPIEVEIVWKNAGGYWYNLGNFRQDALYDISEPIDVTSFKYFGLYGILHKDNFCIVSVDESGNFTGQIIQYGLLEYTNTGMSLYTFRVPNDVDYISLSVANVFKSKTKLFQLKSPYLIDLINKSSDSYNYLFGKELIRRSSTDQVARAVNVPYAIKKDKWYEVKLTNCGSSSYIINVYTTPYPTPSYGNISRSSPILRFKAIADETAVRCWINTNGDTNNNTVTIDVRELGFDEIKNISDQGSNSIEYRVLILGDSYSQGGAWINGMKEWLNITNIVNLGVGSATVRDRYQDRNTYPYTDRPISSDNTGNHNTLSCQIQKLKRLMAGTDLDEGEVQIYSSESDYPNVIIIEGGMNDSYDTDTKEQTYYAQFEKQVDNVYKQQTSSKEVTQGSCYIKTPIDEIDRTCYAGAYRYLVEELLNLFPKAQVFITTCSGLGYWSGSVVERRYRTAEQQRKCANLCAATVIDWSAEGQISAILTHPQGSGTEDDPYVWGQCTLPNTDSSDLMHPNTKGGKKYGHLAANVIKQRFLNIEFM